MLALVENARRERGSLAARLEALDFELDDLLVKLEANRESRLVRVLTDHLPDEFHFTVLRSGSGLPPDPVSGVLVGTSDPSGDSYEYARLVSYVGDPAHASLAGLLAYLGLDLSVLEDA